MFYLWLAGGALLVSVPFYLFHDPYDLWPSLYAGGIGAAVYLTAMVIYFMRKSTSRMQNIIVAALFAVLLITSIFHWTTMDTMTRWQRARLTLIRSVIANGVFVAEDVCERAIPVFTEYHKQRGGGKKIAPLFADMYADKIKDGIFPSTSLDGEYQPSKRYVRYEGDTAVVLISVDTVAFGKNPDYQNLNGNTGRLQLTTRLTAQGVKYERNN